MGSTHPRPCHAASQEAWPERDQTLGNVKAAWLCSRNIRKILRRNDSFLARAPWQELRSGRWLTADRARVYSLTLLAFYAIAIIGWIALSDGLIDRNGKPIGTDFSSFYAAGSLVLEGRSSDVYSMAAHYAREQQMFGGRHALFRLALSTDLPVCRNAAGNAALPAGPGGVAKRDLRTLSGRHRRHPAEVAARQRHHRASLAAGGGRVPCGLRQSRPRSKGLPHRGIIGRLHC